MIQKLPAYRVYRVLTIALTAFAAVLFSLSWVFRGATNASPQWSWSLTGLILLMLGLSLPVRILWIGATLPSEILSTVKVLAIHLPLAGLALFVGGWFPLPLVKLVTFALAGISVLCIAWPGFWRLSYSLPHNFYIVEMVSIFISTGVMGKKEESAADKAFGQWTDGTVEGVPVGKAAPDGPILTRDGIQRKLSDYFPANPEQLLVLNFGSYTCPHHRKRLAELKALMKRWQPRQVHFLTVYVTEAHSEDGWKLEGQYAHDDEYNGNDDDFCFLYAKTQEDRQKMVEWLVEKKDFQMPIVLDSLKDTLMRAYNAWPIRLYVLRDGNIVYQGKQGPFGYAPDEVDATLNDLLS